MFENTKEFSIKKNQSFASPHGTMSGAKFFNFENKTHISSSISYFFMGKTRIKVFKDSFLLANLIKRGFLLGFFVEAFKVGS